MTRFGILDFRVVIFLNILWIMSQGNSDSGLLSSFVGENRSGT